MAALFSHIEFADDYGGLLARVLLEILYATGMRRSEASSLKIKDLDFSRMVVRVLGKGDKERLVMIDFQDARLGPAVYDLASLLKDSYYQLEEVQIERLLDYYIARYEAASGEGMDRAHLRKMFDLMSVQRNFKAIGSFASFLMKRGDPGYLKYIGNTFENIRRTLIKYPQYARLREVLFHYYYF